MLGASKQLLYLASGTVRSDKYWISEIAWNGTSQYSIQDANDIDLIPPSIDSYGNFYQPARLQDPSTLNQYGGITKCEYTGVISRQYSFPRTVGTTTSAELSFSAVQNDNLFLAGSFVEGSGGNNPGIIIVRTTPQGTINYQTKSTFVNQDGTTVMDDFAANTANYVGTVFTTGGAGNTNGCMVLTNSGAHLFSRVSSNFIIENIAADSAGNWIVGGHEVNSYYPTIVKLSNNGTILWQRFLYDATASPSSDTTVKIACDSSNNIYVLFLINNNDYLAKYNSSGVLQWQYEYPHPGSGSGQLTYLTISDDMLYLCGAFDQNASSPYDTRSWLLKLDTTGSVVWSRQIAFDTKPAGAYEGTISETMAVRGNVMMVNWMIDIGNPATNNYNYSFVLPTDGTLGNTYTVGSSTVTYGATTTITSSATSFSNTTSNITLSSISPTITSPGYAFTTVSYPEVLLQIN